MSAALRRYGVKNKLKMLMYHVYIPLFRSFSPCLALAREIVNRLLEPVQSLLCFGDIALKTADTVHVHCEGILTVSRSTTRSGS